MEAIDMTSILFLGRNHTDHTVTFAIQGQRYEYWLHPQACDTIEYLCHKVSNARALAFAKRRCHRWEKLQ
jgi:hypothetical protein